MSMGEDHICAFPDIQLRWGEQPKSGVATVGQVLTFTCFLGLMLPVTSQGQLEISWAR